MQTQGYVQFQGVISIGTFIVVLCVAGQLWLYRYQFKLMWRDYCKRHGIPYNGVDQNHQHPRQGD